VLLAEKLGQDKVITFSGCPGDSPNSLYPNWVTCPWPEDFLKILDYQWNEVLIPYWKKASAFAAEHGIKKICFEMHPGFCVYNPETLLRLREAVGDIIGANFDPSHLFWQGIDPVAAIRKLGKAIYHFHAKDTKIDPINTAVNGVLDTKHYGDEINRSWIFRSIGYGHDYQLWKDIISNLRMVGYDDIISIEHEDSLMSGNEGLQKAISFLKEVLVFEDTGEMFWA
jgi:sugar phosphate isomerase/epimerase